MSWFKTQRRRANRGTLGVIAVLFLFSALARLGDGTGQAIAKAMDNAQGTIVLDSIATGEEAPTTRSGTKSLTDGEVTSTIEAFQVREARLAAREAALEDRLVALRVADHQISEKLEKLETAEARLRDTMTLAETAAENDIDRLTKVYESMKPKQAAALFEEMDPNFAAGFLARMRPEAAAQVMAGLSPRAAHLFSVVLAGRNANVPSE